MSTAYISPKTPRKSSADQRNLRAARFAKRAADDARRQKFRLAVHAVIMCFGVWAFRKTDIHSDDPFEAGTLILVDIVFCIYMLLMVFVEAWGRK